MFFGDQTQQTRRYFYNAWQKYQAQQALTPLETQIVKVIVDHPEYHLLLNQSESLNQDYFPELQQSNPFLHMGLHLALREQIATDRPTGIQNIFHKLAKMQSPLKAEHQMIECLAEALWQAQRDQRMPDEKAYLEALQTL